MKQDNNISESMGQQELITENQLCRRLKVSSGTLRGWRYLGMPHYNLNPAYIGSRPTIRYDFGLVMSWVNERFLRRKKDV